MTKRTPLYQEHLAAGGSMVSFAGWQMPVNYGSQIDEHLAVRAAAGMFDVSHMTIIDVAGEQATDFLRRLIANDVAKLDLWAALYGALLNQQGGVIDDLIVYRLPQGYRVVVNASTRDKVLAWLKQHQIDGVQWAEQDLAMIAVQGPQALDRFAAVSQLGDLASLRPFHARQHGDWLIGRTGYTGEDGVEVMLPAEQAVLLWRSLREQDVTPAGLGARDTLRLEAGLNLYGQDMDEQTNPLISNIGWTVSWQPAEREFVGRAAIEPLRGQAPQKLTGLLMREKGVLRQGQTVHTEAGDGVITSGTYSPSLQCAIALARLPSDASGTCQVQIRKQTKTAKIVKPPFVKHGKILVD